MRSGSILVAGLLLAGCMSLRGPGAPESRLGPLLEEAILAVSAAAAGMDAGSDADFAEAKEALERARIAAVAEAINSPPEALASYTALGVTLSLCREGLDRTAQKLTTEPTAGPGLAAAIRLGCVAPLLLFATA